MGKARDTPDGDRDSVLPLIEQKVFFDRYDLSADDLKEAQIEWPTLEEIHRAHINASEQLRTAANAAVDLLRLFPGVHSIKMRIKDPEHLCEKIIRKIRPKDGTLVTADNYPQHVTDLIGIRALHLFKDEWRAIHGCILETWDLAEQPTAYYREGDPPEVVGLFKDADCDVKLHEDGYRSVHYLIKMQLTKSVTIAELQVRTLFEEGWSEIDHKVRYPYATGDHLLSEFLVIFNRLAGSADEMGTFIKLLAQELKGQRELYDAARVELQEKEDKLRATVAKLKIKEGEKKELQKQVDDLYRTRPTTVGPGVFDTHFTITPSSSSVLGALIDTTKPMTNFLSADLVSSRRCVGCGREYTPTQPLTIGLDLGRCPSCSGMGPLMITE